MIIRPYRPEDKAECLRVFSSNIPRYFSEQEREAFADFLSRLPGHYLVVCDEQGHVVGSGGIAISLHDNEAAALTWGMIAADRHGEGLGRALTEARLALLPELPGVKRVCIDTSHETEGFYERFGFKTVRRIENGYREGLHRCDMERPV